MNFSQWSRSAANAVGSPKAFAVALITVVTWAVSGPFLGFNETWQLAINTGTTICTFLMVFLLQSSQNHDTKALHQKLDELIVSLPQPRDELAGIEKKEVS